MITNTTVTTIKTMSQGGRLRLEEIERFCMDARSEGFTGRAEVDVIVGYAGRSLQLRRETPIEADDDLDLTTTPSPNED